MKDKMIFGSAVISFFTTVLIVLSFPITVFFPVLSENIKIISVIDNILIFTAISFIFALLSLFKYYGNYPKLKSFFSYFGLAISLIVFILILLINTIFNATK